MKKSIYKFVPAMLVAALIFTGCSSANSSASNSSQSVSKATSSTASSMVSSKADNSGSTKQGSNETIESINAILDTAKLEHVVKEDSNDTINIGLPMDLGVTDEDIKGLKTSKEKSAYRETIKWDNVVKSIQDLDSSIKELLEDSKYKHIVTHVYDKNKADTTYLLYKDGKLEKDFLK